MTLDIVVNPLNDGAIQWLTSRILDFHKRFIEIHNASSTPELRKYHPHGLHLHLPVAPDRFVPQIYVFADAHWRQRHADETIAHMRYVLSELGAKIEDFDIGKTEETSGELQEFD
jgi:hypothetical protein